MPQANSYKQIELKDFTPGIFTNSRGGGDNYSPNAPLGAATLTNTYRCLGLPGGGLVPLPKLTPSYNIPTPDSPANYSIVGMKAIGYVAGPSTQFVVGQREELHVDVQEDFIIGTASNFRWYRLRLFDNPPTTDLIYSVTGAPAQVGIRNGSSMVVTRLSAGANPEQPVMAKSWQDSRAATQRLLFWPDPAAPGTLIPLVDTAQDHSGCLIAHQSRVLVLATSGGLHGNANVTALNNEIINYTDPPLTSTMTSPRVLLGTENPNGYGAWGSISSGELILIKRFGGAILINGDIFNPTVINLPGVTSTGAVTQAGTFSPAGLIYCSDRRGVYAWNGSNASQKISTQLDPYTNFFYRSDGFDYNFGITTTHCLWGQFVAFIHNWLYDTETRSWWQLERQSFFDPFIVTASAEGQNLYAAIGSYNDGATGQIAQSDPRVLNSSFSWQSHIIPATVGHVVDVREIELVVGCSNLVSSGITACIITLTGSDGVDVVEVFNPVKTKSTPQRLRLTTSVVQDNIQIRIQSNSGDAAVPAPTIYSCMIKYHEGPPVWNPGGN